MVSEKLDPKEFEVIFFEHRSEPERIKVFMPMKEETKKYWMHRISEEFWQAVNSGRPDSYESLPNIPSWAFNTVFVPSAVLRNLAEKNARFAQTGYAKTASKTTWGDVYGPDFTFLIGELRGVN